MKVDGISKRYLHSGPWIVRDLTADVRPAQLIRVEGGNGSGKTTLLRLLAGVCEPSRGRVTGRPHTGYVPERFPPALPFTARSYLTHLGRVHGLRGRELARRTGEWLDRLGVGGYSGTPLRRLSKGTCQKVALAQALLPDPELLVLDEAWAGLDEAARTVLDDSVAERLTRGTAVIFVDHDPARLTGLAAASWHIEDGWVAFRPAPAEPSGAPGASAVPAGPGVPSQPLGAASVPSGPATVAGPAAVLIEVTGSPSEPADLRALPGVLDVDPDARHDGQATGAPPITRPITSRITSRITGPITGPITRLWVEAGASDAVLRRLLTGDRAVHVHRVRPLGGSADEAGEPQWAGVREPLAERAREHSGEAAREPLALGSDELLARGAGEPQAGGSGPEATE